MVNSPATSPEEEQIAPELHNSPLSRENLISFTIVSSQNINLDLSMLQEVSDYAKSRLDYYEIIVIAAAPVPGWLVALQEAGRTIPNIRILALDAQHAYEDICAIALNYAIGDYIFSIYPGEISIADLDRITRLIATGQYDAVKATYTIKKLHLSRRAAETIVGWFIRVATGKRMEQFPARAFALNRTALSRLAADGGLQKFFRILDMSTLFSQTRITVDQPPRRGLLTAFQEKIRLTAELVSLSATRLILTLALICFTLSILSIFGMVVAIVVKLSLQSVAPGWTSLWVLFSGLFAANFGVLAAICLGLLQLLRQGRDTGADQFAAEISGGDFFHRDEGLNVESGETTDLRTAENPQTPKQTPSHKAG